MGIYPKMPMELSSSDDNRRIQRLRLYVVDSMFSAFRMSPAASSGQCDNDRALFRVTLSRVRKLGSPCMTRMPIIITSKAEKPKLSVYFRRAETVHFLTLDLVVGYES